MPISPTSANAEAAEIIEEAKGKNAEQFAVLVAINNIDAESMAPKHYLGRKQADSNQRKLADITNSILRAQRLAGGRDAGIAAIKRSIPIF